MLPGFPHGSDSLCSKQTYKRYKVKGLTKGAKQEHDCFEILIINTLDLAQKIIKPSVLPMVKLIHFLTFNNSSMKCQQLSLVNGKTFIPVKSIVNNRIPQRKMMK